MKPNHPSIIPDLDPAPVRVLPEVDDQNRDFWTGGFEGELRILRCDDCMWWNHPGTTMCRKCRSMNMSAQVTTGLGRIATFTINNQQWGPKTASEPYAIALVELDDQEDLRLLTNVLGSPVDEIEIGARVRVRFVALGDVAVPVFQLAE